MQDNVRSFQVNGKVLDIPEAEVPSFLTDVPDAKEIKSFVVGKDTLDIPNAQVDMFRMDVPDAKPLHNYIFTTVQPGAKEPEPPETDPSDKEITIQQPQGFWGTGAGKELSDFGNKAWESIKNIPNEAALTINETAKGIARTPQAVFDYAPGPLQMVSPIKGILEKHMPDLIANQQEIEQKINKNSSYKNTGSGVGGFLGGMAPMTAEIAAAIMLKSPTLGKLALTQMGIGSFSSGMTAYDNYKAETGEPVDEGERLGSGLLYAAALAIPMNKYIQGMMPKSVVPKAVQAYFQANPQATATAGKEILENFIAKYPSKAKIFMQMAGKSAAHGAGLMGATELGMMATDEWLIGKDIKPAEFWQRMGGAVAGGAAMSLMLTPFTMYAQSSANTARRKAQGTVTITNDENGKPVEIIEVPDQNGKMVNKGMTPDGRIVDVTQDQIANSFTLPYDLLEKTQQSYKQTGKIADDIERQAFEGRLVLYAKKAADSNLNLHTSTDKDGNQVFVKWAEEDGSVTVVGPDGKVRRVSADELGQIKTIHATDFVKAYMDHYDQQQAQPRPGTTPREAKLGQLESQVDAEIERLRHENGNIEQITDINGKVWNIKSGDIKNQNKALYVIDPLNTDPNQKRMVLLPIEADVESFLTMTADQYRQAKVNEAQQQMDQQDAYQQVKQMVNDKTLRPGQKVSTPEGNGVIRSMDGKNIFVEYPGQDMEGNQREGLIPEEYKFKKFSQDQIQLLPDETPNTGVAGSDGKMPATGSTNTTQTQGQPAQAGTIDIGNGTKPEVARVITDPDGTKRLDKDFTDQDTATAAMELVKKKLKKPDGYDFKVETVDTSAADDEFKNEVFRVTYKLKEKQDADKAIIETQKRLGLSTVPPVNISQNTEQTLVKIDSGEPVTNEFINQASEELYKNYKMLEAMKKSDKRAFTIEQINAMQDYLGEEITRLENHIAKQKEKGEFVGKEENEPPKKEEINPQVDQPVVEPAPKPVQDPVKTPENSGNISPTDTDEAITQDLQSKGLTSNTITLPDKSTRIAIKDSEGVMIATGSTLKGAYTVLKQNKPELFGKTEPLTQDIDKQIADQGMNENPTEEQKKAGNYKKAHITIQGMDISVENPKGSTRSGRDADGKAWEHVMKSHYGYFKQTEGKDGDHIDCFIGPNPQSQQVFVVDQIDPKTGAFDESKVMIGYDTAEQAREAYLENYDKNWKGLKSLTAVDLEPFKKWLLDGYKQRKPFADYKETPNPVIDGQQGNEDKRAQIESHIQNLASTYAEPWNNNYIKHVQLPWVADKYNVPLKFVQDIYDRLSEKNTNNTPTNGQQGKASSDGTDNSQAGGKGPSGGDQGVTREGEGEEPPENKLETSLRTIQKEFGDAARSLAKTFVERSGIEDADLNRVMATARDILKAGNSQNAEAIAEALQYETLYPDNFEDLRAAVKKGGYEVNRGTIERMLEVGIKVPTDILQADQSKKPEPKPEPTEDNRLYKGITPDEFKLLDIIKSLKPGYRQEYLNKYELTGKLQDLKDSLKRKGLITGNGGISPTGMTLINEIKGGKGILQLYNSGYDKFIADHWPASSSEGQVKTPEIPTDKTGKGEFLRQITLNTKPYSTEGIIHETPSVEIAKQIKKDVRRYSVALGSVLDMDHDVDKNGHPDTGYSNIAPAGGTAGFILWSPNSDYGINVSISYDPDYKDAYDDYKINRVMYRVITKENKHGGMMNHFTIPVSVGEMAELIRKQLNPYLKNEQTKNTPSQEHKPQLEPWQMTRDEYTKSVGANGYWAETSVISDHNAAVRKALSEGKPVPKEVLNDYPELKPDQRKENAKKESDDFINTHIHIVKPGLTPKQEEPVTTVFAKDDAMAAIERLKKKLSGNADQVSEPEAPYGKPARLSMQDMQDGTIAAGFFIESGNQKFADYSKSMVDAIGPGIKPYLKSLYESIRRWPDMEEHAKKMDSTAFVDGANIEKILNPPPKSSKEEGKMFWNEIAEDLAADEDVILAVQHSDEQNAKMYLTHKMAEAATAKLHDFIAKGKVAIINTAYEFEKEFIPLVVDEIYPKIKETLQPDTGINPDEIIPHDGWRGNLMKSRDYARRLLTPAELAQALKYSMNWNDPDSIAKIIDEKLNKSGKSDVNSGKDLVKSAKDKFIDNIDERLRSGYAIQNTPKLTALATAAGLNAGVEYRNIKELYDMAGLALNKYILSSGDVFNPNGKTPEQAKEIVRKLDQLSSLLPTETQRSAEQVELQQYSTPSAFAFVANWIAEVNTNDTDLEPSAGEGNIAVFGKTAGADVIANEIDDNRFELLEKLGFRTIKGDAKHVHIAPSIKDTKVTVVVMNPPFSKDIALGGKMDLHAAEKHIDAALAKLEENGRLVAIVGKGMSFDSPTHKPWWDKIRKNNTVRANILVSGDAYTKKGTSFDNRLLVIDKGGLVHGEPIKSSVETYSELIDALKVIPRKVNLKSNNENTRPDTDRQDLQPSDKGGLENSNDHVDTSRPNSSGGIRQPRNGGGHSGSSGHGGRSGSSVSNGNRGRTGSKTGTTKNRPGVGGRSSDGGSLRGDGTKAGQLSDTKKNQSDSGNVTLEIEYKSKKVGDSVQLGYDAYTPEIKVVGSKSHPTKLVESTAMASVNFPNAKYRPILQESVVKDGALSEAQLEDIVLAGASHAQVLLSGERRGFFLGGGTGYGKGRAVAAIIQDNINHGRKKAVWISKNEAAHYDSVDYFKAVGGDTDNMFWQKNANTPIQKDEGVLLMTYGTLKTGFDPRQNYAENKEFWKGKHESRMQQVAQWLGRDFDGVIVFDESHSMANAQDTKGERGIKKASQTALAGIELQKMLPNARVVYASATGATEVSNLVYAQRLGLWGDGTPFDSAKSFIEAITSSGLAGMEIISKDLKSMGLYSAKQLSFDGVSYGTVQHKLLPAQKELYDQVADCWQLVLKNIDEAIDLNNTDRQGKAACKSRFWGAHQRFFGQIIMTMQMPSVITDIYKNLDEDKAIVIQLVSTGEASTKRALAEAKMQEEEEEIDYESLDLSPKATLIEYLRRAFPVVQYETRVDDDGNVTQVIVRDENGKPLENPEAVRKRDALIAKISDELALPESPLDILINTFGADNIAEITGRTVRIVRKENKDGDLVKVEETRTPSHVLKDKDDFMEGKKDILIFSDKGGTGASFHSDLSKKNQKQRVHYVLQTGWRADKAVQGFGRTHRSNQRIAPIFKLVTTDLKAQRRYLSSIAKRLDQLGALTKGQRQTGGQGIVDGTDNLESEYAKQALFEFYVSVENRRVPGVDMNVLEEQMALKIYRENPDGTRSYNENVVTNTKMFLNRIMSLRVDLMNSVFDGFMSKLEERVSDEKLAGTYDEGIQVVNALHTNVIDEQLIYTDEKTGGKTYLSSLELEIENEKRNWDNIDFHTKYLGSKFKGFYKETMSGRVYAMQEQVDVLSTGEKQTRIKRLSVVADSFIEYRELNEKYTKVKTLDEAQELWNNDFNAYPKTRKKVDYIVKGLILPIWNRLPGSINVRRYIDDKGVPHLGRWFSKSGADSILKIFKVASNKTFNTSIAIAAIQQDGSMKLANNFEFYKGKYQGLDVIKIRNVNSWHDRDRLERAGAMFAVTSAMSYSGEFYIPMNIAPEALNKIIELYNSPIVSVEDIDGNPVRSGKNTGEVNEPQAQYGKPKTAQGWLANGKEYATQKRREGTNLKEDTHQRLKWHILNNHVKRFDQKKFDSLFRKFTRNTLPVGHHAIDAPFGGNAELMAMDIYKQMPGINYEQYLRGENGYQEEGKNEKNYPSPEQSVENNNTLAVNEKKRTYKTKKGEAIQYSLFSDTDDGTRPGDLQRKSDRLQTPILRRLTEGERSAVEMKYSLDRNFVFDGRNRIESTDDIAFIFRKLEDFSVENMFACLVTDGKPTIIHLSMGGRAGTVMDFGILDDAVARFKPEKLYLLHNHPSGNLDPSQADMNIHNQAIEAYGDIVQEHILINIKSGKYATFKRGIQDHAIKGMPDMATKVPNNFKVLKFDRQVFTNDTTLPQVIRGSMDVASFLSAQRYTDGQKLCAIILNRRMGINAYLHLSSADFKTADGIKALTKELQAYSGRFGGMNVILFGQRIDVSDYLTQRGIRSLKTELKHSGIELQDYVAISSPANQGNYFGSEYDSMADDGLLYEPDPGYKQEYRYPMVEDAGPRPQPADYPNNPLGYAAALAQWKTRNTPLRYVPGYTEMSEAGREFTNSMINTFVPYNKGVAGRNTAQSLREQAGRMARRLDMAEAALKKAERYFDRMSTQECLDFIDRMEMGDPQPTPLLQDFADTMRGLLDYSRENVTNLGTGKLEEYIENYFPHYWDKPREVSLILSSMSKRPFEGSKAFLKQRTIVTTKEGIDKGLTPVTYNPVKLTLLKLREMERYVLAHKTLLELKANGYVRFVRNGAERPAGFTEIDDKVAKVFSRDIDGNLISRGRYVAAEDAARIINNFLSKGLRGNQAYDIYRGLGNMFTQFQLGLSAFHLGFTSMDASISKFAIGLEYLYHGMPLQAAKNLLLTPLAPVTNILQGRSLMKTWYGNPSTPQMAQIAEFMEQAGGRVKMDEFYRTDFWESMQKAWRENKYVKSVALVPFHLVELASRPILGYIVPRQKLGVFLDMARFEMKAHPNMSPEKFRAMLQYSWNSVDNRMGQLVYDNLFWDKVVKDIAMASVRSVGWNLGTVREVGGAPLEALNIIVKGVQGKRAERTHKLAYVLGLTAVTMISSAIYMFLRTGKKPEELEDYFFPKDGGQDANGNPTRSSLPTYTKDIYHYGTGPLKTLKNKLSPVDNIVAEMITNKDFYGVKVWNEDDEPDKKVVDILNYIGKQFVPFGVRNVQKNTIPGAAAKILPFIGIVPAPYDLNMTRAQVLASEILSRKVPVGGRSHENQAKADLKRKLKREYDASHDATAINQEVAKQSITMDDALEIVKSINLKEPPLVRMTKNFTYMELYKVYKIASDKEKEQLRKPLITKILNKQEEQMPPEERTALNNIFKDVQDIEYKYKDL